MYLQSLLPKSLYRFEARSKAIILDLLEPRWVMSSAAYGGGLLKSRYLVNYTVPQDFFAEDLNQTVETKLDDLVLPKAQTTCVMTAVNVESYSYGYAVAEEVKARVYLTMGLGNLSSPGYSSLASLQPGTINILALVQAELPVSAMVETIQIISEVKTRCLQGLLTAEGYPATGTSTDTITVAFLPGPVQTYAGAVTPTGKALGLATDKAFQKSFVKIGLNPCEPAASLIH